MVYKMPRQTQTEAKTMNAAEMAGSKAAKLEREAKETV